jgi:hypothetical protein
MGMHCLGIVGRNVFDVTVQVNYQAYVETNTSKYSIILSIVIIVSYLFVPTDCWFTTSENVNYRRCEHNILCSAIQISFRHYD